jgi:hypothetical protein
MPGADREATPAEGAEYILFIERIDTKTIQIQKIVRSSEANLHQLQQALSGNVPSQ